MRPRLTIFGLIVAAAASLLVAATAGAAPMRTPFTQAFDNPCTGEMLVATGTVVTDTDIDIAPDGRTHFRLRISFHGMTATAPLTGHKYVVKEQTIENDNADGDFAPSTTSFTYRNHWVRTGEDGALIEDDDFYNWVHIHTTVNANGVPTSQTIEFEDDVCR